MKTDSEPVAVLTSYDNPVMIMQCGCHLLPPLHRGRNKVRGLATQSYHKSESGFEPEAIPAPNSALL